MLKIMPLVFPLLLSAMQVPTYSDERNDKWVLDVERALDSKDYCQEVSVLVDMPEADYKINNVLVEILAIKCAHV